MQSYTFSDGSTQTLLYRLWRSWRLTSRVNYTFTAFSAWQFSNTRNNFQNISIEKHSAIENCRWFLLGCNISSTWIYRKMSWKQGKFRKKLQSLGIVACLVWYAMIKTASFYLSFCYTQKVVDWDPARSVSTFGFWQKLVWVLETKHYCFVLSGFFWPTLLPLNWTKLIFQIFKNVLYQKNTNLKLDWTT